MVYTGIDRVRDGEYAHLFQGRRLGLLTNHSGVDQQLRSTIDLLHERFHLTALFAPEHGVRGADQAGLASQNQRDGRTGVPIYSLFRADGHGMTEEMLDSFDTLVYDIQDVGSRLYTYPGSLKECMQQLGPLGKPIVVLDRPNPLGCGVDGKLREKELYGFSAFHDVPARYGLTIGELADMMNREDGLGCDLSVVPMKGYQKEMFYQDTGLFYVNPSPNLPTLDSVALYNGTCLFEGTAISEGRGTTRPFEILGAPWIDPYRTADRMNALEMPGVRFRPVWFIPMFSKHAGHSCGGVQIHVSDPRAVKGFETGLRLLLEMKEQTLEQGRDFWLEGSGTGYLAGSLEVLQPDFDRRLDDFLDRCAREQREYLPRADAFRIY